MKFSLFFSLTFFYPAVVCGYGARWRGECKWEGGKMRVQLEVELRQSRAQKMAAFLFFFLDFPLDLSLPPSLIPGGASSTSAIL